MVSPWGAAGSLWRQSAARGRAALPLGASGEALSVSCTTVLSNRSIPTAAAIPVLIYPDVRAAVNWLSDAFGFVERLQIGEDHRSQMSVGEGGAVIIGDVRYDRVAPRPGEVTHSVVVRGPDARAHLEHARRQGAKIVDEITDHVYGERQYSAEDPWGHQWTFSQTLADVDPADWGGILRE